MDNVLLARGFSETGKLDIPYWIEGEDPPFPMDI